MRKSKKEPDFIRGLFDSGRATADLAVEAIANNPQRFRNLIDLSFSQPYPIGMRTARVVEIFCEKNPEFIIPFLDEIIEKIASSKIDGVKRSYLKIINDHTGPEVLSEPGPLVHLCFDWLLSPKEAIAVRYHSMGILYKLAVKIPELKPELRTVLEFLMEESGTSAGLMSTCRKILPRL
jgi:hypothetical protein